MTAYNYQQRIEAIRQTKLRHTAEKQWRLGTAGTMDLDDKGSIPKPEGFDFIPEPNHPDGEFYGYDGCGVNYRRLLDTHPVYIDEMSALAGGWMHHFASPWHPKWKPELRYDHLKETQTKYDLIHGIGGAQHFNVDFEMGLRLGFPGLLDKVQHYQAADDGTHTAFYTAELDVLQGMMGMIRRHAAAARDMAAEENHPGIRDNLLQMAQVNEALLTRAPESFHEAVQWLAWYVMFAVMYNNSGAGGAVDDFLYPYYLRDKQAGTLDDETAIFLIACLLVKDNQYYEIGGTYADGSDRCNELSAFFIEAAHRMKVPTSICLRVHEDMDRNLLKQSVRYLFEDQLGTPAYLGHKGVTEGFVKNGFPIELARTRAKTGCHWCALPGTEYTLNDIVKISFLAVFDVAYQEVIHDDPSMDKLWASFERHLRAAVQCIAEGMDFHLEHMHQVFPELVLNLLCHGPVEKGLDISHGGVQYYNLCVDGAALATVADSFAALAECIEVQGKLTWEQLDAALTSDFADERIRWMLKRVPKYGSGNSLADEYARRITQLFTRLVKEKPTPNGHNMIPGLFSWANTIGFGKAIGATPNGRKAGEPISHGANPSCGFKKNGTPTDIARSVLANQCGYGNASPLQLEFDPHIAGDDAGVELVTRFIETYCNEGGTLININIINKDKVLAAHADPSKYSDLIVRVTGFSAYFASLSKDFRQLVVDRIVEGM